MVIGAKDATIKFVTILSLILHLTDAVSLVNEANACDRRPLGTMTEPLPPDNRFALEIVNVVDKYIPNQDYRVKLYSRENTSRFTAFTISAKEDEKPNEKNIRRPFRLDTGRILRKDDDPDTIDMSDDCPNTVIQANTQPKKAVEVIWKSPPKDNKCVTIYALVAVKADMWYSYEGPLSRRVCEDIRKAEDKQPPINEDCRLCEDARYQVRSAWYQLTFEGLWLLNTHRDMFPKAEELARFSDVVGASHRNTYHVWKFNDEASEGLKMLAEQGNTTKVEMEILENLGTDVRTVIKASGVKADKSTSATFRVSRDHHRVSILTGILPSPDWFLGVANLELCARNDYGGQWADRVTLNLYPLDAGTDSGGSFESPNEGTMPPQPISSAYINNQPAKDNKPFARLHFQLTRTYAKKSCAVEKNPMISRDYVNTGGENAGFEKPVNSEESQPAVTTSEAPTLDPASSDDCPMTSWEAWFPCEGECIDGNVVGYKTRQRYHIVDGVVVGRFVENESKSSSGAEKEVSEYCQELHADTETRGCEEPCGASATMPPLAPGEKW